MRQYQVVVGNVGTVHTGDDYAEAQKEYGDYVEFSKSGGCRCSNEQVTILFGDEILNEYVPFQISNYECPHCEDGIMVNIGDDIFQCPDCQTEVGIEVLHVVLLRDCLESAQDSLINMNDGQEDVLLTKIEAILELTKI